ncbi:hypothetical protein J6590_016738 [Homalodisca vitripennis]|nr:hypothetical protein J6590_016738 [Homalodisca vitripennis]
MESGKPKCSDSYRVLTWRALDTGLIPGLDLAFQTPRLSKTTAVYVRKGLNLLQAEVVDSRQTTTTVGMCGKCCPCNFPRCGYSSRAWYGSGMAARRLLLSG